MAQDIPNIIRGTQEDYKKLYYSDPQAALKVPITIAPGYGVLKMGTVLARNTSAGSAGNFLPYDPSGSITGAENAPGRVYLVADSGTNDYVYVTMADSYKFAVGDDIIIIDSDGEGALDNGGAITAIDRTTNTHMAKITFTVTLGDDFTVAKYAFATLEGFNTEVGILEKSVDTGTGQNAKGDLATLIVGNCVLYTGMLLNLDSNAQTDVSSGSIGQYTYIR